MATEFISLSAKDTLDNFTGELRDKLDKAARAGVIAAINTIRDKVKSSVISADFNTSSSKQFGVPLIEGVRTYMEQGYPIGVTHILGNTKSNDGTWRLRFFEGGTKERTQKTTGRKTGSISARWFFRNSISNADEIAQRLIDDRIAKAIEEINK